MTLRLNGDSSGFTEIKAPNAAGDNSITLPTSNGGANQLLQNGGTAGALQYTSAGAGLHYDSSGRLLVGTSSDFTNGTGTKLQSVDAAGGQIALGRDIDTLNTGNLVGRLRWYGNVGGTQQETARIAVLADGNHALNDKPGRIVLSTTGDGGSSVTDRVQIGSDGALKLLDGCPGIDFSAIQTNASGMDSETLDSYEEGAWSPQFFNNGGGAVTNVINANYTKIGNLVIAICYIKLSTRGTLTTSNLMIGNLPFQSNSNTSVHTAVAVGYFNNFANTFSSVTGTVQPNSTNILLRGVRSTSATGTANLNANDTLVNSEVILTASYHV